MNSRSILMPSDSAMRRLSTAARICAPMRVRSKPSHSPITIKVPTTIRKML